MASWSDPVESKGSGWNFDTDPELIATFDRSDSLEVSDPFSSEPYATKKRTIHRFIRDGELVDVWGSADLDGKMRQVEPGKLVRIVYLGKEDLDEGRQIKRFTVQVDESPAQSPVAAGPQDDDIPF